MTRVRLNALEHVNPKGNPFLTNGSKTAADLPKKAQRRLKRPILTFSKNPRTRVRLNALGHLNPKGN